MELAKKFIYKPLLFYIPGLILLVYTLEKYPEYKDVVILGIFLLSIAVIVVSPFYLPVELYLKKQSAEIDCEGVLEKLKDLLTPEYECCVHHAHYLDGYKHYGRGGIFKVSFEIKLMDAHAHITAVSTGPAVEDVYRIHKTLETVLHAMNSLGYEKIKNRK
ncbi:hypothetical protein [Teredinibacter sp. KSP-S5-2]|uniref:hypothetical protein n=1 Tax=Teredinibacter sp. KSP-S5-2 TaxID=3034506 RepID=UPI0029342817|nr:hypothetical protein [Teredinibacter sp. KSP-S5-2]WNO11534.1 hypothetical protein P5V12_10155 [Teredinibacter sp. KSP-S5-2]